MTTEKQSIIEIQKEKEYLMNTLNHTTLNMSEEEYNKNIENELNN